MLYNSTEIIIINNVVFDQQINNFQTTKFVFKDDFVQKKTNDRHHIKNYHSEFKIQRAFGD